MIKRTVFSLAGVLMVTLALALATVPAVAAPVAAQAVPPVDRQTLLQLLESAKGRTVLINFFASWCPPCKEEIPSLVRVRERYTPDQLLLVGFSVDQDPAALQTFLHDVPLNYPVYRADAEVAAMFGVNSIPHNAVFNKKQEIVGNQPGLLSEQVLRQVLDSLVREP